MRLDAEITMLKKRLIRVSQDVDCLTHPYMLKISQMLDVRLNEIERIKKSAVLGSCCRQCRRFFIFLND
ncbi:Spo0E family sporulation regulatory protein-aspartic acid phosphatase [Effusibacillus dendaii]